MKIICLFDFFFPFEILEVESISHELTFGWNKIATISSFPKHQAIGEWEEGITLNGTLVVESINRLYRFEEIAKLKEPVRFTVPTGESYFVVITKISKNKKDFVINGKFIRQEYSVIIERFFDELSIS